MDNVKSRDEIEIYLEGWVTYPEHASKVAEMCLEVLLDIRELLKPPAPVVIEMDKIKDAKRAAGIGPCVMCLGEGFLPRGTTKNICDNCNGSGDNFTAIERLRDKTANQCEWCHGSGTDTNPQNRKILCGSCGGTGKKKQNG